MTIVTDNPTQTAQRFTSITETITNCDSLWLAALSEHWPSAQCLHWGPWHRVFRFNDRVLKIQHLDHLPLDPHQHVRHEYELLRRIEGRAWLLHPTYEEIDGCWSVLGIDWIDGELLSDIKHSSIGVSLPRILWTIFRVSIAGITHRQLRPRHVMCGHDNRVFLIDFGGSKRTSVVHALWHNLSPFGRAHGKWRPGALVSIVLRAWRTGRDQPFQDVSVALSNWRANRQRHPSMQAAHLRSNPGDPVAAEQFGLVERACDTAIARDPRLALETWRLQCADYVLFGYQDLGLCAQLFATRVSFEGKHIVELAAGLAPVSGLALLNGAAAAAAIEPEPELTAAGVALAKGLGLDGIQRLEDDPYAVLSPGFSDTRMAGDIAVAVSPRLDHVPVEALGKWLARFDEVLLATRRQAEIKQALLHNGLEVVETLSQASAPRAIVYARRARNHD